ncbi:MAG: hypothetical protein H7308_09960 [Chthonomonadaceae bacterium]|nr:hypothetical protein [Chthonomonadaceae bacterium]
MSKQWRTRLGLFCLRVGVILMMSAGAVSLPDIETDGVLKYKNAVVALCAVVGIGKALYDTLFYERYGQ